MLDQDAPRTPLMDSVKRKLKFQTYGTANAIQDVFYQPLQKHRQLEGSFMEIARFQQGRLEGVSQPVSGPFNIRQLSASRAAPHRINAFHIHPQPVQHEIWCVLDGAMQVWLVDCRQASPTREVREGRVLTGEQPGLLYIPSGVAHGYKAGPEGALLLYAVNQPFDSEDPNEGRLPWDYFGEDLWDEDRG